MESKICGISDAKTLSFLTNYSSPPNYIGFIVNYVKSKRYVNFDKLKKLLKIDKKNSYYVAVLVKPNNQILEKIKDLPFDYYQIYDCRPEEIKSIKAKYQKKIITAFSIKNKNDVNSYKNYQDISDIYLFDGKGYEKSISFDHSLIENINLKKPLMIAGNIKLDDNFENYKKMADIIDISGALETSGLKDISKIKIFLNKIKQINNET
ncbi:MAG: N-(5'-phosphoribosyl)anthranilate isomerase [Pelagibacteraceae bacterium]|nr:MAG: N-(5'-phosphoribosyl)anthranilate isomerase [Pelagibacteraceae bacterium]